MRFLPGATLLALTALLAACEGGRGENLAAAAAHRATPATAPDTTQAGPYAVSSAEYDFGRLEVRDAQGGGSYETDIHGYVVYPDAQGDGGAGALPERWPLLLFMHGRHQTCETGPGQLPVFVGDDNCPDLAPLLTPAPSYRGYDYLARYLASHGYAVISVDANDINDNDGSGDRGDLARAELLLTTLDAFAAIDRGEREDLPQLVGRLERSRIGLMGHSRGGEGVAKAVSVNRDWPTPHALHAVFGLAPTDYNTQAVPEVVYATLLPYCDGDVEDLMGSFVYDNARFDAAPAARSQPLFQILAMGANHNYFNTVWTTDDWEIHGTAADSHCGTGAPGNERDSPEQQRALGQFFMASFFRYFIGGEMDYGAYWSGASAVAASACPQGQAPCPGRFHLSLQPPAAQRLLLDATPAESALQSNARSQPVRFEGFTEVGHCTTNGRPGEGCPTATPTFAAAGMLWLRWEGPAVYRSELDGLDARGYAALSLRVALSHGEASNADGGDFDLVLIDRAGREALVAAQDGDWGAALFDPPGDPFATGGSEKTTLNMLRLPLAAFRAAEPALDLGALQALELRFGQSQPAGALQLTDLMLQGVAP